jgi:hypothetical protein
MDDTQFTKPLWYTLQETSLIKLTMLLALLDIAVFARYLFACVGLLGAL